ncbi:ketopantoate reductase family protein [Aegicerativicinus sediminis]|uniref:ketopantoate reductase family protein n=1 Tax=Aegicerativicinus sediminis TaxID=2893202 RepID=UPI001E286E88|nr:2-dehydropantoate 2-reductase [Aegicerativicinus sediminis]
MKIVVVGAGGVGGYFGARLAEAGHNVTFVVREPHFSIILQDGLKIIHSEGEFTVHPKVVKDFKEIPDMDLIILAIKSWQLQTVAEQFKPYLQKHTLVLPLQNGVGSVDKLSEVIPAKNILAGFCKIVSKVESPGIIRHLNFKPEIVFGEIDNSQTNRILKLQQRLSKANFVATVPKDIHLEIWKKFLFIATVSGLGGLTRMTMGVLRSESYTRQLLEESSKEIIALAQAKGIGLSEEHFLMVMGVIDNLEPDTTASVQRDIMAGKPSELEDFNGYIMKEGRKLGVDTPTHAFTYYCLLPMEKKARNLL